MSHDITRRPFLIKHFTTINVTLSFSKQFNKQLPHVIIKQKTQKKDLLAMALKLTIILADIFFFCLMAYDMRHLNAKRPLEQFFKFIFQSFAATVLAVITTVFLFNVMTTAKTKEEFKKIDATNATIIQGKKTIQLNAKDLKTISKGMISLPNNQKAYCFDTIDIVNSGNTIDHLEYGTKTTYDDYLGNQIGKTSQKVLRIISNSFYQ